jgi:hypothetical protein
VVKKSYRLTISVRFVSRVWLLEFCSQAAPLELSTNTLDRLNYKMAEKFDPETADNLEDVSEAFDFCFGKRLHQ